MSQFYMYMKASMDSQLRIETDDEYSEDMPTPAEVFELVALDGEDVEELAEVVGVPAALSSLVTR